MKHSAYPKYKPSGIEWLGEVPEHWAVKRGRFCLLVNPPANILRGLESDDEVSFVPMETVGEYGGLDLQRTTQIADIGSGYTEFEDGDVVVAKITPCFENGKGALATGLLNGVAFGTTELHVLRVFPTLEQRFLFYLTISWAYRKTGESEMYGAGGQKRVPPDFCKDFRTPLPLLPEQRSIADYLDSETARIDMLVAKKRELIEKLKEKRTALISRTVTRGLPPDSARAAGLDPKPKLKPSGIDWLGDVPKHWDVTRVKYVARLESGHTPSKQVAEYWVDCEIPWVSLNDSKQLAVVDYISDTAIKINEKGLEGSSARLLPAGAVVFTRDATIGLAAITTREMAVSQHLIAWIPSERITALYLLRVFNAMKSVLDSYTFGATIKTIGMVDVKRLVAPVPPIEEQIAITNFLGQEMARVDGLIVRVQNAIERLQEYRSALITAAVTGRIDVRKDAA